MVDQRELLKKFYYHPLANGSNSIKNVLPTVLTESKELKKLFSKSICDHYSSLD
jgi:hypothetical protein